jgi:hypothetical protein
MLNTKIDQRVDVLPSLFDSNSFRQFEDQMLIISNRDITEKLKNETKGDLFEIFGSFLLQYFGRCPSIMVRDFKLTDSRNDYGVDGCGISCDGLREYPVVVQFKYRHNPKDIIGYGDLANTNSDGIDHHNVSKTDKHSIYLITTGTVSYNALKYFKEYDRLVVIDKTKIKSLVDNHTFFWNYCRENIQKVIDA